MKKLTVSALSLFITGFASAQTDTLNRKTIEEVVVTGQYSPQSINKSLYKVEVINAQTIKNMAATNVAEVLNQNLNMLIVPDSSSGSSFANILGLGGAYTKVLIDNIPVVNDEGLGNLVDLTKISLDNIERIEIVRGSMGVEYGTNALAGVINIITKKNSSKKVKATLALQEETVGKGYDWYKRGKGRHVQNLNMGYNINNNWYVGLDFNHNDFQGYEGSKNGYRFFDENSNGKRGYDWQPKDQINTNGIIKYSNKNTSVFYKVNWLKEEINYRNPNTELLSYAGGDRTFISRDRDYFTNRWLHQLNVVSKLGQINYVGDFSYQKQEKQLQDYIYDVPNRAESSRDNKKTYYDINTLYSRGMFSNFLDSDKFNFQLGYELDRTNGFADASVGRFNGNNVRRAIFNYANFFSAEWNALPNLYIRPGARLTVSDKFKNLYNYSLAVRLASGQSDFRISGGTANKLPTYDELYTYMVDANHDIRGNENLKPENGYTGALFWDYSDNNSNRSFTASFSAMIIYLENRIESAVVNFTPLQYKYINVDKYRTIPINASFGYRNGDFSFNAGVSFAGISKSLYATNSVSPDNFYFYPEANASLNYKLPKAKTSFAIYYKYNGESRVYKMVSQDTSGNAVYEIGKIGSFNMLNATISQPFFNNHFEITAGVKNILDVKQITNTTNTGDAHNAAASLMNMFYGRSFFARLIYNL